MGIRVHKSLGYGVTDLSHTRTGRYKGLPKMTDPRVDWGKLKDKQEEAYETDKTKFLEWCFQHADRLKALQVREHPGSPPVCFNIESDLRFLERYTWKAGWTVGYSLEHDTEFAIPRVFLVIPPEMCQSWSRYDDIIDWVEETDKHHQRKRVVRVQGSGIYPYNGYWIRFRDPPKKIQADLRAVRPFGPCCLGDEKGWTALTASNYARYTGTWDSGYGEATTKGLLLKHLLDDWRPQLPLGVLAVLAWFDCFPDLEGFIDQLRPLLYVRWG